MTDLCERIIVADDWQLLLPTFVKTQIWMPARALRDEVGGNGRLLSACACVYDYDGKLYFGNGRPWQHEEIEDIFGDYGERWLSNFFACDESGQNPRHRQNKFERLRVLHAAIQIVGRVEPWAAE
ncbi:MAG: hypothetical protein AAGC57_11150 [Pseudomonadota bacterium]